MSGDESAAVFQLIGSVLYLVAFVVTAVYHIPHNDALGTVDPNGVDAAFFYEKNAPTHRPDWVTTARVGSIDYVVVDHAALGPMLTPTATNQFHVATQNAHRLREHRRLHH